MSDAAATDLTDGDGPGAPPRANGELVFTAPWQPRVFATTMRLEQRGLLDWETFRQGLISEIAAHESNLERPEDFEYWGCWLLALESLLARTDVVEPAELRATSDAIAARPPDH